MAKIEISIDTVAGKAKIKRLLEVVEPRTVLTAVGARFLSYIDESFRTQGRGRWKAMAWTTAALRSGGEGMLLQNKGHYKQSFPPPVGRGALKTDNKTFVEIGGTAKTPGGIPLANIHEEGTKPYTIRVRNAKVLAAKLGAGVGPIGMTGTGRMAGWLFFGKEVHHPGVPARPVLPDQRTAERLAQETINAMLARVKALDT